MRAGSSMQQYCMIVVRNLCSWGMKHKRSLCFPKCSVIRCNVVETFQEHNVWVREYVEGSGDIAVSQSIELSKLNLRVAHDVSNL